METAQNTESGQEPVSGQQGEGTADQPFDQGNKGEAVPSQSNASTEPASAPASSAPDTSDSVAAGTDVIKAQQPEQKQQGADKPLDQPAGHQAEAVKEKKDEGEAAMAKRDPNDHSGEPLKVHDGSEKQDQPSVADAPQEESAAEQGTGEKVIKSSGLAADGGDFDATNAGAGQEANRLLEEKGVHKSDGNSGPPQDLGSGDTSGSKDKVSMKDKIKDKLHIGHKS